MDDEVDDLEVFGTAEDDFFFFRSLVWWDLDGDDSYEWTAS